MREIFSVMYVQALDHDAHLRALMTRKSCAVGMRNAILTNHLISKMRENYKNLFGRLKFTSTIKNIKFQVKLQMKLLDCQTFKIIQRRVMIDEAWFSSVNGSYSIGILRNIALP